MATDVDDGHSSTLAWRIKFTQPGLFGTPSISGTGTSPTSFTYTPQSDYYGTGGNDFFVVQVFFRPKRFSKLTTQSMNVYKFVLNLYYFGNNLVLILKNLPPKTLEFEKNLGSKEKNLTETWPG